MELEWKFAITLVVIYVFSMRQWLANQLTLVANFIYAYFQVGNISKPSSTITREDILPNSGRKIPL